MVLDVPYFTQPTAITCQATCLKMYAAYLARSFGMSHPASTMDIQEIWKAINTGDARPERARNSYRNMAWWLQQQFPSRRFAVNPYGNSDAGSRALVSCIDRGYPAMVSTNHARTKGHIILVVGYQRPAPATSRQLLFVCHDPYGKFDPQLSSKDHGRRRFVGGQSLVAGGETGPGRAVVYDIEGVRRSRPDQHSFGTIFVISGA